MEGLNARVEHQDGLERPDGAGLEHLGHDLRCAGADLIPERLDHACARHRNPDRHAARRGHGAPASAVAARGRQRLG